MAVQKLAQGNVHCVNGWRSSPRLLHLPAAGTTQSSETVSRSSYWPAHGHTKGSLTGSETDNEDVYLQDACVAPCAGSLGTSCDNVTVPATPLSAYQIPRTPTRQKPQRHGSGHAWGSARPPKPPSQVRQTHLGGAASAETSRRRGRQQIGSCRHHPQA